MPWSNQNGGGPWGGSNKQDSDNKSPWGKKPTGFGSGGGSSSGGPDFDDILRKGQQTLKNAGGGFVGLIIIAALLIFWLFQCFYTVKPYQVAVELFLGKPKNQITEQGLHFRFWPLETVLIVDRSQKQVTIGQGESGFMLSGDQNIVNVRFAVRYNVENPIAYLFNLESPDETLKKVAESAMREVVGRRPVDQVYRDDRLGIAQQVQEITQETLNRYGSGILLAAGTGVTIEDAKPPHDVKAAFDAVQKADQERERLISAGNQYLAKLLGDANGRAARIRADALAYKEKVVQEATGRAQRFETLYSEASKVEEVTRLRIYFDTVQAIFSSGNTLVIDPAVGGNMVPYLPLDQLMKGTSKINQAGKAPSLTTGGSR